VRVWCVCVVCGVCVCVVSVYVCVVCVCVCVYVRVCAVLFLVEKYTAFTVVLQLGDGPR